MPHCISLATFDIRELRFEPTVVKATMAATEISAAIRPYSMAVAPCSSLRSLQKIDSINVSPDCLFLPIRLPRHGLAAVNRNASHQAENLDGQANSVRN